MSNFENALQQHALTDLTNRAKGGIVLYLLVWLALGITFQLPDVAPKFFYINLLIFVAITVLRALHLVWVTHYPSKSPQLMINCLILLVLITAIHWGGVVAWIVYDQDYSSIRYTILITTPAFAIAGAVALCISNVVRIIYPLAMYLPGMVVLFMMDNQEDRLLAFLAIFSIVYVFATTAIVRTDYWSALQGRLDAERRADMMEEISVTDPLTKLKNRMYFDKQFDKEWKRCLRLESPISVLMIDLDHFKSINDTYGHAFGDEYLVRVARVLSSKIQREGDCLARYGGEEFVVLLPDTEATSAGQVGQRLIEAISDLKISRQQSEISVTCSIGGATMIPSHSIKHDYLLKKADVALYQAKHNGRNQYCEINWESIE